MRGGNLTRGWLGIPLGLLALAETSAACTIPVFRYAMEFWPPDSYRLMVSEDHQGVVEEWLQTLPAASTHPNLEIAALDGKRGGGEGLDSSEFQILVPNSGSRASVWSGSVKPDVFREVIDSPARRAIANRLVSGEAAVWVFLEGASPEWNQHLCAHLERELSVLEGDLTLPVDPATPDAIPEHPTFSLLRVSRTDPGEEFLVRSLLVSEGDLDGAEYSGSPMVFPIFGRGRILYALVGEGITARNIEEACRFMVGPCSCQVKDLNPGFDLLLAVDWDSPVKSMREEAEASSVSAGAALSPGQGEALRSLLLTLIILSGIVLIGAILIFQRERAL